MTLVQLTLLVIWVPGSLYIPPQRAWLVKAGINGCKMRRVWSRCSISYAPSTGKRFTPRFLVRQPTMCVKDPVD
nr:hypothetical protein [Tanacetum cinerariifolium]